MSKNIAENSFNEVIQLVESLSNNDNQKLLKDLLIGLNDDYLNMLKGEKDKLRDAKEKLEKVENILKSRLYKVKAISYIEAENMDYTKFKHLHIHQTLSLYNKVIMFILNMVSCSTEFNQLISVFQISLLICFLIYEDQNQLWSCKSCSEDLKDVVLQIADIKNCSTIEEIFSSHFKIVIINLTLEIKSQTWKSYPLFIHAFNNLIIKFSTDQSLINNFNLYATYILLLIDDYNSSFVVIGINLLEHVMSKVPTAVMRMHGWANVFHDALFKKIFLNDHIIVGAVLPALLTSLKVIRPKLQRKLQADELVIIDKTFVQVISSMLIATSSPVLLQCYFKVLPGFMEYMGIEIVGHLKELINLYLTCIEIADDQWMVDLLKSLNCLLKISWMRIKNYALQLFQNLLCALVRLDNNSDFYEVSVLKDINHYIYLCIKRLISIDKWFDLEVSLSTLDSVTGWKKHLEAIKDIEIDDY